MGTSVSQERTERNRTAGRRAVLLVVDDPAMRDMVLALLEDEGIPVVSAGDGDGALGLLADGCFDAILCDLQLPRTGPLPLLEELRSRCPESRVIVMTAFGNADDARRAIRSGAFDLVPKPFGRAQLMDVLRRALVA